MSLDRDQLFWPKSFLRELNETVVEQGVLLWFLGSPSFMFRTPQATVYIDPYFGPTPPEADECYPGVYRTTSAPIYPSEVEHVDLVISTHAHTDHCYEPSLLAFQESTAAQFIGPLPSIERMQRGGIDPKRTRAVAPGEILRVGDLEIEVFDAHDPDSAGAVTYLFGSQGVETFISGDTREGNFIDEIALRRHVDIALFAFGGFYMSSAEMLAAAQRLKPKLLLPFHWEVWRGMTGDPFELGKLVAANPTPFDVKLLQIGDRIHYSSQQGMTISRGKTS